MSPGRRRSEATGETRRAAYLLMSHTRPPQVLRLIRALRALSPDAVIVVHHDQRVTQLTTAEVTAAGADVLLSARHRIGWGDISQVDALLYALSWLEEHVDYDWVIHLSGQDYPVGPLRTYEERLRSGGADAYLRFTRVGTDADVRGRWQEEAVRRYFYQYRQVAAVPPRALAQRRRHRRSTWAPAVASAPGAGTRNDVSRRGARGPWFVAKVIPGNGGIRLGMRARRTPFRDGYSCYKGSYWVTLSRRAVRRLLAVSGASPELYRYFARTSNPDESYVPTVLANDPLIVLAKDEYRYLDWTQRTAHPGVLSYDDLEGVVRSGRYLARKFDIGTNPDVLDALDDRLGIGPGSEAP